MVEKMCLSKFYVSPVVQSSEWIHPSLIFKYAMNLNSHVVPHLIITILSQTSTQSVKSYMF